MSDNLLLPIELTKILYSEWEGQLQIVDDQSQLYGKSLNGPCKVTFKNGNRYEGDFKNGLLHGKGKFTWANGIVYEGDFKNNKLEGNGVYRWTDGAVYEGEVQNGLRHGKGKLTLDVCTYEGDWKNGYRHGHGKITFSNSGVYEGEFQNGVKSGKGRMYYPSGNFYDGEWKQDAKNGQGTMRWMDSHQKYTGQWLNNLQHGFGVHIWLDGRGEGKFMRNRYQGEWKAGLRDGFGVFYYANGSKYEGEWQQNMKEGTALFTNQFGNLQKVEFSKDRLIKQKGKSTSQIDEKLKTGFISNNKQVQANPYTKMLSLRELYLPDEPNLQQLYNLLLRNNSLIKTWYKNLSTVFDSKSELSFSLSLEGIWKIVRNLKVLGKISLARIDRKLSQIKLNLRNVVEGLKEVKQPISIHDIKYILQSHETLSFEDSLEKTSVRNQNQDKSNIEFYETNNIHDGQKIILLKQFSLLLVVISQMLDSESPPHKSVQKCLEKIGPVFDSLSRNQRKSQGQSRSQNISTGSKSQKNIPMYARNININLFNRLTDSTKGQFKPYTQDRTISFLSVIQLFRQSNLLNDTTDPAMLERFLDKNMDSQFLSLTTFSETHLNPKFSLVADYELIEYEFIQLLFYYLIKKLPSTKETEQNKQKYMEFVSKMSETFDKMQYERKNYIHQSTNIRILKSPKLKQKEKLVERRKMIQKIRFQQESLRKQKQQQSRERILMEINDVDVMSEHFQSEDDQYSQY